MPKVTYIHTDGSTTEVLATAGTSVMKAAVANDVKGIIGDCGGSLACATCHVYVEPDSAGAFSPVSEEEDEMLDEVVAERRDESRLSCQLTLTDGADVTVAVPQEQW
jgi:ferredoxin, 2Fe-2S